MHRGCHLGAACSLPGRPKVHANRYALAPLLSWIQRQSVNHQHILELATHNPCPSQYWKIRTYTSTRSPRSVQALRNSILQPYPRAATQNALWSTPLPFSSYTLPTHPQRLHRLVAVGCISSFSLNSRLWWEVLTPSTRACKSFSATPPFYLVGTHQVPTNF